MDEFQYVREQCQERQGKYYNEHSRKSTKIHEGDRVRMLDRNKWEPARVISECDEPRSLNVKIENGNTYRRNRSHIIKTESEGSEIYVNDSSDEETTVNNNAQVEQRDANDDVNEDDNDTDDDVFVSRSGRISRLPERYRDGVT